MLLQMAWFLFSNGWATFYCIYIYKKKNHIFFIHSSVYRHLSCFHVLTIANSAVMNTGMHVYFWTIFFQDIYPEVGWLDHMLALLLVF